MARARRRVTAEEHISDAVFQFTQEAQVAILSCAYEDYVSQAATLWRCLRAFPKNASGPDLTSALTTVCRVARHFVLAGGVNGISCDLRKSKRRSHVNRVLGAVHERYRSRHLTLGSLAREINLSSGYLSRSVAVEMKLSVGSSFRMHVNGVRLLAAVIELTSGSFKSHAQVSESVGYISTGELDRQFHRLFGVSPRECKQALSRVPPDCLS
jgi:AraC-like DNA-binding protein